MELSPDDVSEIIKNKLNSSNFEILNYQLDPLSERIGLLGEHAILRVDLRLDETNKAETLGFFAKFFPAHEAPAHFARGIGAFEKEIFIYKLFNTIKRTIGIEMLADVVCDCYLTRSNQYLIFDNLLDNGFEPLNKHEYLDVDVIANVLSALAKLHGSSLIAEETLTQASAGKPYRFFDEYPGDFVESFFDNRKEFANHRGIQASIKCVLNEIDIFDFERKLLSGKDFRNVLETVCGNMFELVKPSQTYRNVICHGDLWATNFLIKPNGHCKFVDFQCGRYCPPAHDVMSLLYLTTSREFRTNNMYQLLGMYYNNLEKYLKFAGHKLADIIPFHDFLQSCEEQKVFALVQTAIYFPLILINNSCIEKYFSNKELNAKALMEDRSYLVLEHLDKDSNYKARLRESLQDLKDYCEYL